MRKGRGFVAKLYRLCREGFALAAIMLVLVIAGCGGTKPEPAKVNPPAANQVVKTPTLSAKPVEWKPDGVISDNEYAKMQQFGDLEVFSRIDGDKIRMALKAKTNGYVAIGFEPSQRMQDADIILGYVKEGKATVADMLSTGPTGPHPPDEQQGGKNDLTVFGGSNKDGITIIEFERKLDTCDAKDKAIKSGDNKIIWAISEEAAFSGKHPKCGSGVLKL